MQTLVLVAILMGIGATLVIDLWALVLKRALRVRSLDYCLLGRWVLHMPRGTIVHQSIAASAAMSHECKVGWTTHYLIGITFALLFVLVAPDGWLIRPTLMPALIFGIVTVLVPFFTLQPSLGLGLASSKTPHPNRARLKSLTTHAIFGVGLYLSARLVSGMLQPA